MTQHKHLKQLIRERQKKTGETYSTARMNVLAQLKAQLVPRQNSSGDGVLPAAKAAATHKSTMVVTSLASWVAGHRLDAAALEQLEARAITDSGRSVDMDKLAACAKAVLIAEMIDGIPRRLRPYTEIPADAMRVEAIGDELEVIPSDSTPVSETLVQEALEVAAAFSGGAEWQIDPIWPVGRLTKATALGRKAVVRFLRLAGARVLVSVHPGIEEAPSTLSTNRNSASDNPDHVVERTSGQLDALAAHAGGIRARDLIEQAEDFHGPEAERRYTEAEQLRTAALHKEASNCTMLCSMGKLRLSQARGATEPSARQHLEDALHWFERAVSVKSDFFMARVGRGDVQLDLSRCDSQQPDAYLSAAIRDYQAALQIRGDLYLARVGLGNAYLAQARHQSGDGAARQLMASQREFEAALELKPSLYRALVGLGDVLVERSKMSAQAQALTALASAWKHYQHALQLRPSLVSALCGCGDVELERSRRSEAASAGSYRASAVSMFERALAIQPSSDRAATGRRAALDASL